MKTLLLLALVLSAIAAYGPANAFAAKGTKPSRKVSNSVYFVCHIERESSDKKVFKKEMHFPFPTEKGESYELKGSMRWNDWKIVFSQDGEVQIRISELLPEGRVAVEKIHQMGKEPQFESFKVQVDLKREDGVTPYHIQCSPE